MRRADPLPVRLYRWALVILPGRFRREHGPAMVAMLRDEWCDVRGWKRLRVLARSALDLVWTAIAERTSSNDRRSHAAAARAAAEPRGGERRLRVNVSWLDVRLGVRMVAKYPGLSLVSVLGMAVAIAIGAFVFGGISSRLHPELPLPDGNNIVAVENNRVDNPGSPERQVLHDFVEWRSELTTVRDLAAYRRTSRNLIGEGRGTDLVRIAETSAAIFRVAPIPPLLGRPLLDDDERAGAPPVLVIGQDEWQRRSAADPHIIGRTVRLGETVHTVVGVMRDGFRFSVNHGYWVPLRLDVSKYARGDGPLLQVIGRLADGATIEQARAQISTIGRRKPPHIPTHTSISGRRSFRTRTRFRRGQSGSRVGPLPGPVRRESAARAGRGERAGARLCAYGDADGRDRGAHRARGKSRPRDHAAVRRSARPISGRGGYRPVPRRYRARMA